MSDAVIRAPRDPESKPTGCPTCRSGVLPWAKKCANCGEWLGETRLNATDQVLRMLGYLWAMLSVGGAIALWLLSDRQAASAFGGGSLPTIWASLPVGVTLALLLQGLIIGLAVVSFAQRGPREWVS